mmetsp:Transcript_63075/g.126426  ORF Transcript_63075/g.126426 Transcript_63075/m.126426 type:complete len:248 (+) Transcript_63075:3-746(+)
MAGVLFRLGRRLQAAAPRDVPQPTARGLDDSPLCSEVHADDAEALFVAIEPLEIVEGGPSEVAPDVSASLPGGVYRSQVRAQEADAVGVLWRARLRIVLLRYQSIGLLIQLERGIRFVGATILRDHDAAGGLVAVLDVEEHLPQAPWHDGPTVAGVLPRRILEERDQHVHIIEPAFRHFREGVARARKVGAVAIDAEEVGGSLQQCLLRLSEGGQARAASLAHAGGVVAEVDWIGKPTEGEVPGALC